MSNAACVSFTPTKSCLKNLAAMIRALADLEASSKTAVFGEGLHDGARRNYFFQGMKPNWGECDLPRISACSFWGLLQPPRIRLRSFASVLNTFGSVASSSLSYLCRPELAEVVRPDPT